MFVIQFDQMQFENIRIVTISTWDLKLVQMGNHIWLKQIWLISGLMTQKKQIVIHLLTCDMLNQ